MAKHNSFKGAGEAWKNLSDVERKPFVEEANKVSCCVIKKFILFIFSSFFLLPQLRDAYKDKIAKYLKTLNADELSEFLMSSKRHERKSITEVLMPKSSAKKQESPAIKQSKTESHKKDTKLNDVEFGSKNSHKRKLINSFDEESDANGIDVENSIVPSRESLSPIKKSKKQIEQENHSDDNDSYMDSYIKPKLEIFSPIKKTKKNKKDVESSSNSENPSQQSKHRKRSQNSNDAESTFTDTDGSYSKKSKVKSTSSKQNDSILSPSKIKIKIEEPEKAPSYVF